MSVQLLRRRFTVDEYHQIAAAGILNEDDRVELIEGEIVEMSPIGTRHAACVNRLIRIFSRKLGEAAIVAAQNPIRLSDRSEPQPDLALLQPRQDFYAAQYPLPKDIFLLIEVADTSIQYDREVKIPLYAGSGITEVWLVNLNEQAIEVYRQPSSNGYQNVQRFVLNQTLYLQAFPDVDLKVDAVM